VSRRAVLAGWEDWARGGVDADEAERGAPAAVAAEEGGLMATEKRDEAAARGGVFCATVYCGPAQEPVLASLAGSPSLAHALTLLTPIQNLSHSPAQTHT
jgi:hypothetical protein